jgi:hypothetical protein
VEEGNAGPSARRLNSFAAQRRRGEFGWLAQDDNLFCFIQLSWIPSVDTAQGLKPLLCGITIQHDVVP